MITLGFLQNPWFKPGTDQRHIDMYQDDPNFHRKVLAMSATGRALKRAFGDEYDEIFWDNANPISGETREHFEKPDFMYMARRVAALRPHVVLLFGAQAMKGWGQMVNFGFEGLALNRQVLSAPHPMARGSAKKHLEKMVREYDIIRGSIRG